MRRYFEKTYLYGYDSYTKKLTECLEKGQKKFVVTANPETFMIAEKNLQFKIINFGLLIRNIYMEMLLNPIISCIMVCARLGYKLITLMITDVIYKRTL